MSFNGTISILAAVAILALLFGLFFLAKSINRLWKRRIIASLGHAITGLSFVLVAAVFGGLGANFYTFERLTHNELVANIEFKQIADKKFIAKVTYADSEKGQYELHGDTWVLEARVIKWKPRGNVIGLDTKYRLERLLGRYSEDKFKEQPRKRKVYNLTHIPGISLLEILRSDKWLPYVDVKSGVAVIHPMKDGAKYRVTVDQTSLVSRPVNEVAKEAVKDF